MSDEVFKTGFNNCDIFGAFETNQLIGCGGFFVLSYAKSRVIQLHATVVTTNQAALRLYEKNGFKVYGTEPRSLKVGNQFYDEHMLILVF